VLVVSDSDAQPNSVVETTSAEAIVTVHRMFGMVN